MKWNEALYRYYTALQPPPVPDGISWLNPYKQTGVRHILQQFLEKYYNDTERRHLLLGINPGRFGAGVTGVNFTAPRQLQKECGIIHPFRDQSELSAEFIYEMIGALGGPTAFYKHYFIGSVCPLGFTRAAKNLNYYDEKDLVEAVEPFITDSINQLVQMPFCLDVCYCIGGEKNYKFLSALNKKYQWFQQIVSLPHPRFIMQYRRKQKQEYVELYRRVLTDR